MEQTSEPAPEKFARQPLAGRQALSRTALRENRFFLLALAAALGLVYCLFVLVPFGASDDYYMAYSYITGPQAAARHNFALSAQGGRILHGLLLWLAFRPASIADLALYRLVNLALVIGFSYLLFAFLQRVGVGRRSAFLLSLIICVLPSFQILFFFACLMGVLLGGIFAGLSAWRLSAGSLSLRAVLLAALLLLVAVQFYQPPAMLYWVFVAAWLAAGRGTELRLFLRRYLAAGAVFVLAMAAAYVLIRIAPGLTGGAINARGAMIGPQDVLAKVVWFFHQPLPASLNFFLLRSMPDLVVVLALLFIFAGLVLWFTGSTAGRAIKAAALLSLLPLSYAPNLVVLENWPSYRTMIALSSLWVLLLFLSGRGYASWLRRRGWWPARAARTALYSWAALALVLGVYHSAAYLILPGYIEHRFIAAELGQMELRPGDTISVIQPTYEEGAAPFLYGDEFGFPSSDAIWGTGSLTYLVLRERDSVLADQVRILVLENAPASLPDQPGTHVLDLRRLRGFQLPKSQYPLERVKGAVERLLARIP